MARLVAPMTFVIHPAVSLCHIGPCADKRQSLGQSVNIPVRPVDPFDLPPQPFVWNRPAFMQITEQNPQQIRMFLTRMGMNTKMIITGDLTQIDLPREQRSGLKEALKILDGVEGIGVVKLGQKDIVRHKLVTRIVNAYDKYDKERAEEKKTIKN